MNNFNKIKEFYNKKEVQKRILNFSKNREIAFKFEKYYSKRPQIIDLIPDIMNVINQDVLSFHCSEERWSNPLLLGSDKLEDRDKNRVGWDLILDLDGLDFFYSKIVGSVIIDFFNSIDIENSSAKFSGNKGFHIGIPFEAFSNKIIGEVERRFRFPELPKKMVSYILTQIDDIVSKKLLTYSNGIEEICKKHNFEVNEFFERKNNKTQLKKLWWIKFIDIDTILISSRHLFRMPYSINEKSGLVSIPIDKNKIIDFERNFASIENIDLDECGKFEFLKFNGKKDCDILIEKTEENFSENAFSELAGIISKDLKGEKKGIIFEGEKNFEEFDIQMEVEEKDFPKTISYILNKTDFKDGRKRAIFLILTFLYSIKIDSKIISSKLLNWNKNLDEPLKANYIMAQLSWFESQKKKITPPNFSNDNYYSSIGIEKKTINEDMNKFKIRSKNPLHYIYLLEKEKTSKTSKKTKKVKK